MHILIAKSDLPWVNSLRAALEAKGAEVTAVLSGAHALRLIDSQRFDAMLVSTKLEGIGGLQVLQTAREGLLNRKVLAYIVAPQLDAASSHRAKRLGAARFWPKGTVDVETIAAQIAEDVVDRKKPRKYDVRVINAVVEASSAVFEFFFGIVPKLGTPHIRDADRPVEGYMSALIEVSGNQIEGSVAIIVKPAFLFALSKRAYGESVVFSEEMFIDIAGELCNQVVGQTQQNFAKLGLEVKIGDPILRMGVDHKIEHRSKSPITCFEVGVGKVSSIVEFCFEQQVPSIDAMPKSEPAKDNEAIIKPNIKSA